MILSCGEALIDLTPDPTPGGGPMNVAIAAARLGVPACFVGRVSTDQHGQLLFEHMRANGVDLTLTERGAEPTATAEVDPGPPLVFTFRGDDTADMNLHLVDLDLLDQAPRVLHGGTLGLFRGRTADTLADLVERFPGLVSVDPNVRPQLIDDRDRWDHYHDQWVARASIYKASDEDLEWAFPGRSSDTIAAELVERGCRVVAVTHGPAGATLYTSDGAVFIPGRVVEVVDTVGAGDSFAGSLLASIWERMPDVPDADGSWWPPLTLDELEQIGLRAVAAAAFACQHAGAVPPTLADLDSL